jgi:lipopolysaccharide export system protein LptC
MPRRDSVNGALTQPIARGTNGAPDRLRRDWTARTRDTALNALRYSRFVLVMKRVLPISAGLIVAAVIAYSLVPRQSDKLSLATESIGVIHNDLTMTKPRLSGTDNKGRPFVVTADSAVQDTRNVKRATLNNVEADLTLDKGRWLNATAAKGYYDMEKGAMTLEGGITVYSDDGYELHTARAAADLKKGFFRGSDAITGHGPAGTLTADSFELDRKSDRLILRGHVEMTLMPAEVKAK